MPTLFSLILFWGVTAASAMVLVPYVLNRYDEGRWTDANEIAFWLLLSFVSTAMGAMCYVLAYPKGGRTLPFFIGAAPFVVVAANSILADVIGYEEGISRLILSVTLFPLALVVVQLRMRATADAPPAQPTGMMRATDRMAYMLGNLYFGISQIVVIVVFLILGTIHETSEGGERGNESALANYYNAPWFGALFFIFFLTIYCATMRKYPFRISQIGWLTVHSGLLILILGGMGMFWGSFSGNMQLLEGETNATAYSRWERVLEIEAPDAEFKKSVLVTTDRNPQVTDERQEFEFRIEKDGRVDDYRVTLDGYYPKARMYDALVPNEDRAPGESPTAAVRLELRGIGPVQEFLLVEGGDRGTLTLGPATMSVITTVSETILDGIGHRYAADQKQRGEIIATKGGKRWNLPILPVEPDGASAGGRAVKHPALGISDHGVEVHVVRYFDAVQFSGGGSTGLVDTSPGATKMPALEVRYEFGETSANYLLSGDGNVYPLDSNAKPEGPSEVELSYRCTPEISFPPNEFFVLMGPGERRSVVISDGEGDTRLEPLEIGREYRFSDEAPLRIAVTEAHPDARQEQTVAESTKQNPFRAIRVTITDGKTIERKWLPQQSTVALQLGQRVMRLGYKGRPLEFPFSLSLLDFRHINYPNSRTASVYETNLVLRDGAQSVETATLVDMNHPLEWGGYRFFNGSPIEIERGNWRGVVLNVNRNPGYWTLVIGTFVTTLGMVLVFFFKPRFRTWERRRRDRLQAAVAVKGA